MNLSFTPPLRQLAPWVLILVAGIVAVAAYLPALNYPFISDDRVYLTDNTKLTSLHLVELWRLFIEPYNAYEFLPLRDLSYWFDIALFGLTPAAFRIHNIILYLLCLPLVYGTTLGVWRYFRPADTAAPWAAAAVTALFVIHPAHVESVVWISGRKDVLSGLFSLLALWLAVNAKREQGIAAPYAIATLIALLVAMLSKASNVPVALIITMLWVMFWHDTPVPRSRSPLLWPIASLLVAGCTTWVFTINSTIREPVYFATEIITRALAVLGWLFRFAVTPESRHFFYPVLDDPSLAIMVGLGVGVLIAAIVGIVMLLRKRSLEGFAVVVFLLLCLPYMQLIPYRSPSLVVDRFVFLAVWPITLLLVALIWRLSPMFRIALLLIIVLPLGFQTIERPNDWRSSETMIDADLRTYPGYYMPAFQKIMWLQLPQGLNREANETASNITDSEIREVVTRLIEADYAVRVDAVNTGNPLNAMVLLRSLEPALKQLPDRAKGNAPMRYVWKYSRNALVTQWNRLATQFPDNALIRDNAESWALYVRGS